MKTRHKIILSLIGLALFDTVIPIPIMVIILLVVMFQKPPWFKEIVDEIYGDEC